MTTDELPLHDWNGDGERWRTACRSCGLTPRTDADRLLPCDPDPAPFIVGDEGPRFQAVGYVGTTYGDTPVVTRDTLVAIVASVTESDPTVTLEWNSDGDRLAYSTEAYEEGDEPTIIARDERGLFDLSDLGWVFWKIDE